MSSIRAMISILNKEDSDMCLMDIKTAFQKEQLLEKVFMEIPDEINVFKNTKLSKFCNLKFSSYGFDISPKICYKKFCTNKG